MLKILSVFAVVNIFTLLVILNTTDQEVGMIVPDYVKVLFIGVVNCLLALIVVAYLTYR